MEYLKVFKTSAESNLQFQLQFAKYFFGELETCDKQARADTHDAAVSFVATFFEVRPALVSVSDREYQSGMLTSLPVAL